MQLPPVYGFTIVISTSDGNKQSLSESSRSKLNFVMTILPSMMVRFLVLHDHRQENIFCQKVFLMIRNEESASDRSNFISFSNRYQNFTHRSPSVQYLPLPHLTPNNIILILLCNQSYIPPLQNIRTSSLRDLLRPSGPCRLPHYLQCTNVPSSPRDTASCCDHSY